MNTYARIIDKIKDALPNIAKDHPEWTMIGIYDWEETASVDYMSYTHTPNAIEADSEPKQEMWICVYVSEHPGIGERRDFADLGFELMELCNPDVIINVRHASDRHPPQKNSLILWAKP